MKCGVGDYTKFLANALGERGDVSVAVLTDENARLNPPSSYFHVFPVAKGWKFSDMSPILETIRHFRPDIIHIQFPTRGYGRKKLPWLLSVFLASLKIPTVQTWHEYYPMGGFMNIPNAIVAGGLVAVRPNYLEKMPGWFRWLNRRKEVRYIPNASSIPVASLTDADRNLIRTRMGASGSGLIVYFGFAYPAKEIEALFEIADPQRDRLVLICDLSPADAYQASILAHANRDDWAGKVTVAGFLPPDEAANLLAAADAVVLPFRDGGGEWNSSIHSAAIQGTFVLTNSREAQGYDEDANIYYALPSDVPNMRSALRQYAGRRRRVPPAVQGSNWDTIASAHVELYQSLLEGRR